MNEMLIDTLMLFYIQTKCNDFNIEFCDDFKRGDKFEIVDIVGGFMYDKMESEKGFIRRLNGILGKINKSVESMDILNCQPIKTEHLNVTQTESVYYTIFNINGITFHVTQEERVQPNGEIMISFVFKLFLLVKI